MFPQQRNDSFIGEVWQSVLLAHHPLVQVGELSVGLVVEIVDGEVQGNGTTGRVAEIRWIAVNCVPAEESGIAGLDGCGEDFGGFGLPAIREFEPLTPGAFANHGDGSFLGAQGREGNPGRDHEPGLAGLPTTALGMPVVVKGT